MDPHDRMEQQLDNIEKKMDDFIGRVIKLEVKMSGFITIGTLVLGAVVAAVVRLYIQEAQMPKSPDEQMDYIGIL